MTNKRALFIDRDGVINKMVFQESGIFDSPQNIEQVALVDGISDVISWCNHNNIPVIEVSNQPGTAKNKMSIRTLNRIEQKVHQLLNKEGVNIDKSYRCLHHPHAERDELRIDCDCRKPKPGMLLKAASELNIDLKSSVMLGDNATDMEAGEKTGMRTILFLHNDDLPQKTKLNQEYCPDFRVYNHKETLSILIKLFK